MKKSINYLNKFTFFGIIFFLFQSLIAQNNLQQCYKSYEKNKMEKVYVHLNNVQYEANQTMFFSIYVTLANNEPTNLSDFVYVDILDGSNKKKATQTYLVDQGKASGSFKIPNESSGLYKIVAYTKYQKELNDSAFERSFFIQKVVSPRILMSLEFKKKSYGKGEIGEVDLPRRNRKRGRPCGIHLRCRRAA